MQYLGGEQMTQSSRYTFKYNSDNDSIDLDTLLISQIHFGTVLSEIKNEVAGNAALSIKIRPLEKGSVPFDIILNVAWIRTLISPETIAYASGIISILVGLFQIRLWLKGEKPTQIDVDGDKVTIKKGDVVFTIDRRTYLLYERNATIDLAIKKAFEAIEKDDDVTGIELQDENKKRLIEVPRENFEDFIKPNEIFESLTQKEPVRQEVLTVYKVVFDKGHKWQFFLNGRKISATIPNAYMDRLKAGERFGMGDTLVVNLEIEKVYDKALDIFIDKEYRIIDVIKHTPRPKQSNLFDLNFDNKEE